MPEYNQNVYEQIFDLVFHGQGGFTFRDVYELPVNLRAFYYKKLSDILKLREESMSKQNQKGLK